MYKQNNDFHSAHIKMGINESQAETRGCTIIPNPAMEENSQHANYDYKDGHVLLKYRALAI